MRKRPLSPIAGRAWKAVLLAAAAVGLAAFSGCDLGAEPDLERGRALFTQNCGSCHTLAEAGAAGDRAPNLDATFADARASGMTDSTIAGVTRDQIANPRSIREDDPLRDQVFMPADIVTGEDAEDVAAYVGSVAGVPGIGPPDLSAEQLFTDLCGACHTLAAAGTASDVGPDLDEVLPGQDEDQVSESIADPTADVTPGFEPGVMPEFGDMLTDEQIAELARFLLESIQGEG